MHRSNVRKLYKTILRLHRALPNEMQELGNQYVRDEFRRHKEISREHVAPFMLEWTNYCSTLANQIGVRGPKTATDYLGRHLEPEKLDDFEEQQIVQLYELRKTIAPIPEEEASSRGGGGSESMNLSKGSSIISKKEGASVTGGVATDSQEDIKKLNSSQLKRPS